VPLALAGQLADLGHNARTARAHGASHARDYEQLRLATELQRTLITHNEQHFRELHSAWRLWLPHFDVDTRHSGILVIPQPPRTGRIDIADEINALAEHRTEFANSMWLWRTAGASELIEPRATYFPLPDS
jgi:hypothetical protein